MEHFWIKQVTGVIKTTVLRKELPFIMSNTYIKLHFVRNIA